MIVTGTEATADGQGASESAAPISPEEAARLLFQDPRADIDFTPRNDDEARRAVEEFARLFETAPGVFKDALEGARAGAETLSHDRLQGLAEIIQNADDAGASYVGFQIVREHLIAVHDGTDVTLSDVLALATPWLSNKTENELATGRFGIGLMTLRALSDVLDVHSGPYHIRLGDPTISSIAHEDFPRDLAPTGETALCLQLRSEGLDTDDIAAWLGRWDDSALLFLRSVRDVTVVDPNDKPVRTLRLEWGEDEPTRCSVAGHYLAVQRRHATAPDGRRWLVHATEAPRPPDVRRVRKAAGATVPLGLALALQPGDRSVIYAGLPIVDTGVPLQFNAQFDPITSRTGLAPTRWNSALLPLLADLWVEVVEDLLAERPVAAWDVIPLPNETNPHDDTGSVVGQIENLLIERARTELAAGAALVIDGQRVALTDLAVEDEALTGVVDPPEVARLAGLEMPLPMSARDDADRWRDVLDDWRDADAPLPHPQAAISSGSKRTSAPTLM